MMVLTLRLDLLWSVGYRNGAVKNIGRSEHFLFGVFCEQSPIATHKPCCKANLGG
jgi:hypothetical protein